MKTFDPATVRNATRVRNDRTTKQAAFIVEALVLLVFILGSMAVLMPVSYTHLDVYKRQEQGTLAYFYVMRPDASSPGDVEPRVVF